jgi:hypothetical protein
VSHPRYCILRELGRGGMGVVYHARQTLMDREVAIKVINKSLLDHPDALERFQREVKAAAKLSHPNIVTAYDAEQAGDLHLLVMEFVPGRSLAEVLEKKGPLPVAHACHYVRQAAEGLQHAHERGMVHRDIKPHNLMVTPKGQVKILDFGLAKVASERAQAGGLTAMGAYMGTPEYSAPEQAADARAADIRADLYSLGCTLYCLLAGHPPFQEDTAVKTILAHIERQPRPLTELRPDVAPELWAVVARLLAKGRAERYQTPAEVAQVLAPFCKAGTKTATVLPGVASPGRATPAPQDTSRPPEAQAACVTAPAAPSARSRARPGSRSRAPQPPALGKLWWLLGGGAVAALVLLTAALWLVTGLLFKGDTTAPVALQTGKDRRARPAVPEGKPVSAPPTGDQQVASTPPAPAAAPPVADPGFTLLFNGKDLDGWCKADGSPAGWNVRDGVLEVVPGAGHIRTRATYGPNLRLRAEFRIPVMADRRGQARGNSGIFLLGRHEVQIVDDVGNDVGGPEQRCGALYGVVGPSQHVTRAPGQWQAYDVEYHAPRFDTGGDLARPGRVTVVFNGTKVIDGCPFSVASTTGAPLAGPSLTGPIALQEHGAPVQFRNLQVRELPDEPLPREGPSAAAPAPAPVKEDPIKDTLDRARAAYKDAVEKCRQTLLEQLDKREEAARKDGIKKVVDQAKAEREAFTERGELPKGAAAAAYRKGLKTAAVAMEAAYQTAIKEYTRAREDGKAQAVEREMKQFKAEADAKPAPRPPYVVATWVHQVMNRGKVSRSTHKLYSNGHINSPDSPATWQRKENVLILRWPDPGAPGGAWQDVCTLAADGSSYVGKNQQGATIAGVRIANGPDKKP